MADFWVITALEEILKHVNVIVSSKWVNGTIPEAEGLGLLDLVKEINNNTKRLAGGDITIYSEDKKVINGVFNEIYKESKRTQ